VPLVNSLKKVQSIIIRQDKDYQEFLRAERAWEFVYRTVGERDRRVCGGTYKRRVWELLKKRLRAIEEKKRGRKIVLRKQRQEG
jgi:hypothetical protein